MTSSAPKPPRQLDLLADRFNAFLFATIGLERNGTQLSVLSAFARLDRDPWSEAARLGSLPAARAVENISLVIEQFHELTLSGEERLMAARRLAGLLPKARITPGRKATGMVRLRQLLRRQIGSPRFAYLAVLVMILLLLGSSLLHTH